MSVGALWGAEPSGSSQPLVLKARRMGGGVGVGAVVVYTAYLRNTGACRNEMRHQAWLGNYSAAQEESRFMQMRQLEKSLKESGSQGNGGRAAAGAERRDHLRLRQGQAEGGGQGLQSGQ